MVKTKAAADTGFDCCVESYGVKYPAAVEYLTKDRADLLALCDLPAEHWQYVRTKRPIESTFASACGLHRQSLADWGASGRSLL